MNPSQQQSSRHAPRQAAPQASRQAAQRASIMVDAPETASTPLSTWDVGLRAGNNETSGAVPAPIELAARFTVPAGGPATEQVELTVDAPGVVTPTTATTAETVAAGDTLACAWRYAPPVPSRPAPYSLPVVVTARYVSGGSARSVRETAEIRVPAPPAPTETGYLSDLEFSFASNGFGPVERDRENGELAVGDGPPLKLGGTTYEKGLGVHAASQVSVNLGGTCSRFTAVVGIDDAVGNEGSAVFVVRGDGEELFASEPLTGGGSTADVDVEVTGVQRLDLVVRDGGDGRGNDHADWADARIHLEA